MHIGTMAQLFSKLQRPPCVIGLIRMNGGGGSGATMCDRGVTLCEGHFVR